MKTIFYPPEEAARRRAAYVPKPRVAFKDRKRKKITLDCIHLGDPTTGPNPRRRYRECEKGHGPQCCCDHPQKCGAMCKDYDKETNEPE